MGKLEIVKADGCIEQYDEVVGVRYLPPHLIIIQGPDLKHFHTLHAIAVDLVVRWTMTEEKGVADWEQALGLTEEG